MDAGSSVAELRLQSGAIIVWLVRLLVVGLFPELLGSSQGDIGLCKFLSPAHVLYDTFQNDHECSVLRFLL